ncbi:MAG: hypothetical protein ABFR50_11720 [Candidatus Fermentibacteria bacterium]
MKNLFFILVLVIAAAAVAEGTSYTSTTIWTQSGSEATVPVYHLDNTDALDYYTDLSVFEAANPGLTPEDYSSTLVPPNNVASDTGPLDYYTDNSLFALNTIVDGISLDEQAGGDVVVLTPPFAGVTSVSVGPNTFDDDAVYDFTLPTRAFGGFIVMPNGGALVNIEVFGALGSLGTTSATGATGAGTFWGVSCYDEDIVRIEFSCPGGEGELFADVQFGLPTALDRTTWGELKASF